MAPTLNGFCTPSSSRPRRPSVRRRQSRWSRLSSVPPRFRAASGASPGRDGPAHRADTCEQAVAGPGRPGARWPSPRPPATPARESAPRWRCTTNHASASGARRSSQVVRSWCRAALPMRIGGFDQMPVEPHRGQFGHVVRGAGERRAAARRPPRAGRVGTVRDCVLGAEGDGPLVHVERPHLGPGGPSGQGHGDGPVAAAQVEHVAHGVGRMGRLLQQETGAGVDALGGEDPAIRRQGELQVGEGEADRAPFRGGRREPGEVLGGGAGHRLTVLPDHRRPRRGGRVNAGRRSRRFGARAVTFWGGPARDPDHRRPRPEAEGGRRHRGRRRLGQPGRRHVRHHVRRPRGRPRRPPGRRPEALLRLRLRRRAGRHHQPE